MIQKILYFTFALFVLSFASSCKKEFVSVGATGKLAFSTNQLLFDTVFTTIGSTTKIFVIRNPNSNGVSISSIQFGAGTNSVFAMNIDGISAKSFTNIVIPGKDSLFVFVKVTVNPTNQSSPLVIRDSIQFITNGNKQYVQLEAWGQDAYYHYPNKTLQFSDGTSLAYSIINCAAANWVPGKPHVIYGYAVVDSGCTLTIQPNVTVYMHNNAVLWVYKGASIVANGTSANPIVFQGDRLEPSYANIAGQWGKIWLSPGSTNNIFNWTVIKNASIGIEADTIATGNYKTAAATLTMSHSIIQNASIAGLYAVDTKVYADNCLFSNCGQFCGAFVYGGFYRMNQCTFGDYWNSFGAQRATPAVLINNWYQAGNGVNVSRSIDSATFANCIVYGNLGASEVGLDSALGGKFNYRFKNSLLYIDNTYPIGNTLHNDSVYTNNDPLFQNPGNFNFTPGVGGGALGIGSPIIGGYYPMDLKGNARPSNGKYDAGAIQ